MKIFNKKNNKHNFYFSTSMSTLRAEGYDLDTRFCVTAKTYQEATKILAKYYVVEDCILMTVDKLVDGFNEFINPEKVVYLH